MDIVIFNFFNSLANRNFFFDLVIIFFAKWLPYFIILIFLVYYGLKLYKNKITYGQALLPIISATIARGVIKEIIVFFYSRPRPFEVIKIHQLLGDTETGGSFPSGHAIFFFALSAGIYSYNKKAGLIFLIASSLMTLARIAAGLHWPSDILAGAVLGIAASFFIWTLMKTKA